MLEKTKDSISMRMELIREDRLRISILNPFLLLVVVK